MQQHDKETLLQAQKAIVSTRSKSEKALPKLKEGTYQHTMTQRAIAAYRIALSLVQTQLEEPQKVSQTNYTQPELVEAVESIRSAKARVENILPKFEAGTSQHTLAIRRIAAFDLAIELMQEQMCAIKS